MNPRERALAEYQGAMQLERDLWDQVKGRAPGQPGFRRELWDKWLHAVADTNAASRRLREAFDEPLKVR